MSYESFYRGVMKDKIEIVWDPSTDWIICQEGQMCPKMSNHWVVCRDICYAFGDKWTIIWISTQHNRRLKHPPTHFEPKIWDTVTRWQHPTAEVKKVPEWYFWLTTKWQNSSKIRKTYGYGRLFFYLAQERLPGLKDQPCVIIIINIVKP